MQDSRMDPIKEVTFQIYSHKSKVTINMLKITSIKEILYQVNQILNINVKTIRVFSAQGVEYQNSDIRYLKHGDECYLTQGEEFDPLFCLNEYECKQLIGKGAFGEVYRAVHKQNEEVVAIKFIQGLRAKLTKNVATLFKETQILKSLQHPNVIQVHKCFALKDMRLFIMMEYMEGGELGSFLAKNQQLPHHLIRLMFRQIALAVKYCHNRNIIHKDLKPENILLLKPNDPTVIKVADFGIATSTGCVFTQPSAGTLRYLPPQILLGKQNSIKSSVDIWALGCILYLMVFKVHPFPQKKVTDFHRAIKSFQSVSFPQNQTFQSNEFQEVKDLISRMLQHNHEKRLDIYSVLEHEWITGQYFQTRCRPVYNEKISLSQPLIALKDPKKRQQKANFMRGIRNERRRIFRHQTNLPTRDFKGFRQKRRLNTAVVIGHRRTPSINQKIYKIEC